MERLNRAEGDSSHRVANLEEGLARALRDTRLFSAVFSPSAEAFDVDFVLRGDIQTKWGSQGFENFLTYFPGGLVFAPSWRGTRWKFKATADLQLIDNRSGAVIGTYSVESAHELVHRTGNPWHFLGAAAVIPGTIVGSGKSWVRANYRKKVHEAAYPELWRRVAARIAEDRGASLAAELAERRESCGERYDTEPSVGESWDEYRNCQPGYFRKQGERQTSAGTALVFEDTAGRWKIYVVDGQITQWDGASGRSRATGP